VCGEKERLATVRGCKWVDEVVEGVPYVMSDEYLRYVIEKYRIDYVVHGDDPCIVDGKDVYESAVRMGKRALDVFWVSVVTLFWHCASGCCCSRCLPLRSALNLVLWSNALSFFTVLFLLISVCCAYQLFARCGVVDCTHRSLCHN
jgi:hypothetical protein